MMQKLQYQKKTDGSLIQEPSLYKVSSIFKENELADMFLKLKANVCDLNPALVTKCITGTEQDFIMLMNRAKEFVEFNYPRAGPDVRRKLLDMFQQCVFGYYVLTPLIIAKDVSDIKVLGFDHIVVKANGERYVADATRILEDFDEELQTKCVGSISERFEGDPPYNPRGSVSHATSVGGLLFINQLIEKYTPKAPKRKACAKRAKEESAEEQKPKRKCVRKSVKK